MRARFAFGFVVVTVFSTTLMSGCDINPQPEVPSDDDDGTGGEAGAPNTNLPGTVQRADDDDQEYDDLDPNSGFTADKSDQESDSGRPDVEQPPPQNVREDAGIPGVVN